MYSHAEKTGQHTHCQHPFKSSVDRVVGGRAAVGSSRRMVCVAGGGCLDARVTVRATVSCGLASVVTSLTGPLGPNEYRTPSRRGIAGPLAVS